MFGGHLTITNEKHKNMKMWHKTDHEKDTCLQYGSWKKKAERCLGWGRVYPVIQIFATLSSCQSTVSIDLGVANKILQVGKFTNTESINEIDVPSFGIVSTPSPLIL